MPPFPDDDSRESELKVGGASVVALTAPGAGGNPAIVRAEIAPGRGMLLLQASVREPDGRLRDLLESPPIHEIARRLDGGPEDFAGNGSFMLGGAILLPYANRVSGTAHPDRREIAAEVGDRTVRLPRNWGGQAPGAPQYAMHGLMLDLPFEELEQPDAATLTGRVRGWDFGGCWRSRADVEVTWRLRHGALKLDVVVRNAGDEPLPMGVGWHPWFALPSGRRDQALLTLAAQTRLAVGDYDAVLPTGERLATAGTPYDFRHGAALGELYLDDCFTDLQRSADGELQVELADPAGARGVRVRTVSLDIKAVQICAPSSRPVLALEPQFNWPDPFGDQWPQGADTGMRWLAPGEDADYRVTTDVFVP